MADPASVLASDRRFSEAVKKGLEKDEFGQRVHGIFRQVCADTVDAGVKPEAVALHLGISNKNLYKLRSQSHGKYPTLIMAWKLLSLGSPVPEAVKVRAVAQLLSMIGFTPAAGRLDAGLVQSALAAGVKTGELTAVVMDAVRPDSDGGVRVSIAERAAIQSKARELGQSAATVGAAAERGAA